jgi:hypothetical protein
MVAVPGPLHESREESVPKTYHLFCKVCGVRSFARGQGPSGPMAAINTRCLDEVDATTLNVQYFDGKSR